MGMAALDRRVRLTVARWHSQLLLDAVARPLSLLSFPFLSSVSFPPGCLPEI